MIIAVDFDGVITKQDNYPSCEEINVEVISILQQLQKQGDKIILWTCRCDEYLLEAENACIRHGLIFDAVNDNIKEQKVKYNNNSRKVYADFYLDDKSTSLEILKKITNIRNYE